MNEKLRSELIKARKSLRKKYEALKRGKMLQEDELREQIFNPIIKALE